MRIHNVRPCNTQISPLAAQLIGLERAGIMASDSRGHRANRATPGGMEGILPTRSTAASVHSQPGRTPNNTGERVNSYYNHFSSRCAVSTDDPPTYATVKREERFMRSASQRVEHGKEELPGYSCTIFRQGQMQIKVESCSPFMFLPFQEWRTVWVVLQGTQMKIYKYKTPSPEKANGPPILGRLLSTYTMQHAEVGLATDVDYSLLIPASGLAKVIPSIARKAAHAKNPELFDEEKQHCIRIRAELDQFILTTSCETTCVGWVNDVCASIDIAPAIDERTAPRQCTMPRRRRRRPRPVNNDDLIDERFIENQRRLLAMYPGLAADNNSFGLSTLPIEVNPSLGQISETSASTTGPQPLGVLVENDNEDVDLAAIAEINPVSRPASIHQSEMFSTTDGPASTFVASRSSSLILNFDENGKWAPPHFTSEIHQVRYIRRCLPVLRSETPRHSSVMIANGRYVRPNHKMDVLEDWELVPPPYEAHNFGAASALKLSSSGDSDTIGLNAVCPTMNAANTAINRPGNRNSYSSSTTGQTSSINTTSTMQLPDIQRIDSSMQNLSKVATPDLDHISNQTGFVAFDPKGLVTGNAVLSTEGKSPKSHTFSLKSKPSTTSGDKKRDGLRGVLTSPRFGFTF